MFEYNVCVMVRKRATLQLSITSDFMGKEDMLTNLRKKGASLVGQDQLTDTNRYR